MLINLIAWIIFGAIVGWIASLIMGTDEEQGGFANIAIGILGAIIGGFVSRTVGGSGVTGFNLTSFVVALLGALILIGIFRIFSRPSSHRL